MSRGRLIVFEGMEGVGKSTQLRLLAAALDRGGVDVLSVREPGETVVGEGIRRLLLDPSSEIAARTEALLFMASRAELVERTVRPALAAGRVVLADRFFLSTYAYQVAGRGLPEADVHAANRLATNALVPDLTILLALPVSTGMARATARGGRDRMELAGEGFLERAARAFELFATAPWQRAHAETGPIELVDAEGSESDVFARVSGVLGRVWPELAAALAPVVA